MGLFLFRFWPVLIPLIIYWVWWRIVARRAEKASSPRPRFRDGPWYWAVLASLATGIFCFIYISMELTQGTRGTYTPPHLEDGKMIPGRVEP